MALAIEAPLDSPLANGVFSAGSMSIHKIDRRPAPCQDIRFAGFRLVAHSRTLLYRGRMVPLGSRAFDVLHCLARSAGAVVSKEQLVREVWPTTIVEESNLRFQMAGLRKALGPQRNLIKTIPGRGYLFTADCSENAEERGVLNAVLAIGESPNPVPSESVAAKLRALIALIEEQLDQLEEVGRRTPSLAWAQRSASRS